MTKLTLLLFILLGELQYSLWFGKNGIYALKQTHTDLELQKTYNSALRIRNDQLLSKVKNLRHNLKITTQQPSNINKGSKNNISSY
ncbi:Cell division protein FtsB [Candidatus Erwinia haradaeae]|uniref:Cell division protein FtsB, partial n=2 Tax=Candidatus Erwinia haradaeae TaxID=1922217 RepID=A0A451CZU0_9GAMM|nr:Cell division protein FtsB [Candidatus Erwinia haradaeae]